MKVLVSANYTSGKAEEGGSSRLMKCIIDELVHQGHEITSDKKDCDVAICSHDFDASIESKKIFISQGVLTEERCRVGADVYVSISEEVRAANLSRGFKSTVIPQPIKISKPPSLLNSSLKNILIIRDSANLISDPFEFLHEKYDVKISDMNIPIEDQIQEADLCITLGRGALESMALGVPVLIADNRHYMGAFGDGYVTALNIDEIALSNFSGRRFKYPINQQWVENELKKYNPNDGLILYEYVMRHHDVENIVKAYLNSGTNIHGYSKIAFGCMVNDMKRFDLILKKSNIEGHKCFTIFDPETATKGLNALLDILEKEGTDIAILTHQDMFYQEGWLPGVRSQLAELPEDWVIAGVVGKDEQGKLCGKFHDMSSPMWVYSDHEFPVKCSCIDECTIIVNMKSGFRFEEELIGFDLYGTYACLRASEMGSSWIIDAWAEHYCTRFFGQWEPDEVFMQMWKWLYNRFPGKRLESTVLLGEDQ